MRKYRLAYFPSFADALQDIATYITEEYGAPQSAARFLDSVEKAVTKRLEAPEAFPLIQSSKKRLHEYRYIRVGNFLILYVVIEDLMQVRRIVYATQNLTNIP